MFLRAIYLCNHWSHTHTSNCKNIFKNANIYVMSFCDGNTMRIAKTNFSYHSPVNIITRFVRS